MVLRDKEVNQVFILCISILYYCYQWDLMIAITTVVQWTLQIDLPFLCFLMVNTDHKRFMYSYLVLFIFMYKFSWRNKLNSKLRREWIN